nr:GGDEF domain-containing protein [Actinomycetota bacterium]
GVPLQRGSPPGDVGVTRRATPVADPRVELGRPTRDLASVPRRLFATVLAETYLPVAILLAHRALLAPDASASPLASPYLASLVSGTVLGSIVASWALLRLHRTFRALRELSRRDELTGAYNRRAGEERLAEDLARSGRGGGRLSLAIVDADGLKQANDSFGHAAGDACLRRLADALRRNVREGDWVARWGGDEFVVGLWDAHDPDAPRAVLERVADELRRRPVALPDDVELRPTFSAGLGRALPGDTATQLLARADRLLYEAKRDGRARGSPSTPANPPGQPEEAGTPRVR